VGILSSPAIRRGMKKKAGKRGPSPSHTARLGAMRGKKGDDKIEVVENLIKLKGKEKGKGHVIKAEVPAY